MPNAEAHRRIVAGARVAHASRVTGALCDRWSDQLCAVPSLLALTTLLNTIPELNLLPESSVIVPIAPRALLFAIDVFALNDFLFSVPGRERAVVHFARVKPTVLPKWAPPLDFRLTAVGTMEGLAKHRVRLRHGLAAAAYQHR